MRRAGALLVGLLAVMLAPVAFAPAASADRVLMVGSYHGIPGQFTDVQAAINAAGPDDWILVAPGDYHEAQTLKPPGGHGDDRAGAGILITKAGLWLRGMNRNKVWIDGTKPGSPRCSLGREGPGLRAARRGRQARRTQRDPGLPSARA